MYNFEQEVKDHVAYLEDALKNMPGVAQGYLITNDFGEVTGRVGRMSMNPPWYRDFYRMKGRKPYKKELKDLAIHHLTYGYYDSYGFIPPLHQRQY